MGRNKSRICPREQFGKDRFEGSGATTIGFGHLFLLHDRNVRARIHFFNHTRRRMVRPYKFVFGSESNLPVNEADKAYEAATGLRMV